MAPRKRILVVMGTRPEAIKLAPLILRARADAERFEMLAVRTSQHKEMLDQVVTYFDLPILADLNIMRKDQNLAHITMAALEGLQRVISEARPDVVVVQGDTTTSFVGALAAFYENVPVAHVEAGLRTYDKRAPFPEEVYRRLTSVIADYHFAPTETARYNLLKENVPAETIWVTGNTAIDALLLTLSKAAPTITRASSPTLLLTTHRRENHGEPMRRICDAVLVLLERFPNLRVVCPVHLSPRVRQVVEPMLGSHPRVSLIEPLAYEQFVLAMNSAHIILSDSGGVQEEAPALGKPVLVLRDTTERPEAVEAGTARLVGTEVDTIVSACEELLTDPEAYRAMAQAKNPFGDGHASEQILDILARSLDSAQRREKADPTKALETFPLAGRVPAETILQAAIAAEAKVRMPTNVQGPGSS
ncbi:UDP-N-acetylglucosamine 2-epimerase (non-hydrolyzing) [Bosea sp. F3-2]|uniref:non-hydrolyzing UDP-N-acetylglucosamine 2-epimerase n=1 Tax=Bosea sp. F3-2 TaxID=2599640 RepID=UPI0011EFCA1E|nr:UDP-N-acetylglucosamine 2-epimerase (non-hydrolyzing) [Bosea sp. F3-2]QEL22539.1 UDP-N-acetylglucosamine 2-epimerase (non-hydrolyzing) [Bosea sp. F3-2]